MRRIADRVVMCASAGEDPRARDARRSARWTQTSFGGGRAGAAARVPGAKATLGPVPAPEPGYAGCMEANHDVSEDERETVDLVGQLRDTGDTRPLIALLKGHDGGPERARDALSLLGELDPQLLVQVTLDTLIREHFDDPAAAAQTRRIVRGAEGDPGPR